MKIRMKPLSRKQSTLLQSSIFLSQCNFESMIFPFSRWDILVLRRVCWLFPYPKTWIFSAFLGDDSLRIHGIHPKKPLGVQPPIRGEKPPQNPKLPWSSRDFFNFVAWKTPKLHQKRSHSVTVKDFKYTYWFARKCAVCPLGFVRLA